MIKETLELLSMSDWYGQSEYIEIAKGKNKRITTFKELVTKIKRYYKWQTRKR